MMDKPDGRTAAFSSGRYGLLLILLLLIAAAAAFLLQPMGVYTRSAGTLTEWEYTAGSGEKELETAGTWETADAAHPVQTAGKDCLILRRELPPSSCDALWLRLFYGSVSVRLDGEEVYDGLVFGGPFAALGYMVPIEPADRTRTLEITVYSPLAFSFHAGAAQADSLAEKGRMAYAVQWIWCALSTALSCIMFIVARRRPEGRRKIRLAAGALLLCGILFAAAPLAGWGILPAALGLRITLSGLTMAVWMAIMAVVLNRMEWSPAAEVWAAAHFVYAICLLCWPYTVFFDAVAKAGLFLQLGSAVFIAVMSLRGKIRLDTMAAAAVTLPFTAGLLYWLCLFLQAEAGFMSFSPAALLVFCAFCFILWVRRTRRADGQLPAQAEKVIPADLPAALLSDGWETEAGARFFALLDDRCAGLGQHALRVADYTRLLCRQMGMGQEQTKEIAAAALFHDIGKLEVKRETLYKTDRLTAEEFEEIQRHTLYGYRMLEGGSRPFSQMAARVAYEHHEHVDGSGYMGLAGEDISPPARIVAVADVFDALTSPRGYKQAWSFEQAFAYICEQGGGYFDKEAVRAFCKARPQLLEAYRRHKREEDGSSE